MWRLHVKKRWVAIAGLGLLLVGGSVGLDIAATRAADRLNRVYRKTRFRPSPGVAQMHSGLLIADLHADSLLWNRDLNERHATGHVDLPRLIEGNVALQVFGAVTKTPKNLNPDRNDDSTDDIGLLALAQRWPPATWNSLRARALYQASSLHRAAAASRGQLVVIRTRSDLDRFVDDRSRDPGKVAAILALEGAHALEGKVENVDVLFDAGFRMLAPAHFFDNDVSGSAHGVRRYGLTEFGRRFIQQVEQHRMIIDLAHASKQTIDDVLAIASRPVVVSHTGVRGTCANNRNLTDSQLERIAQNGGVVGIGYWRTATCGADAKAIGRAIRHAATVAGVDHVALGSDFDGAVTVPFDTAGLVQLTQALVEEGFDEKQLRKIMGGNVLRVLRSGLP
jgi:membrane dipeptidase